MRRVAILVGVSRYERDQSIRSLQFTDDDCTNLHGVLKHEARFDHVHLLRDPAKRDVLDAVEKATAELVAGDLLVFFFAGHGISLAGKHLLLCRLARLSMLNHFDEAIPVDHLRDLTAKPGLSRVFILDSCRSDLLHTRDIGFTGLQGEIHLRDVVAQVRAPMEQVGSLTIICSCAEGKQALELPQQRGGLFTIALLRVLQDTLRQDAEVTISDAFLQLLAKHMTTIAKTHGHNWDQSPWLQRCGPPSVLVPGSKMGGGEKSSTDANAEGSSASQVAEIAVGMIQSGKVVSIKDFGAFIEFGGGHHGLCHVSELAHEYVERVTDVVNIGDTVRVKVISVDSLGRIKLSIRAAQSDSTQKPEITDRSRLLTQLSEKALTLWRDSHAGKRSIRDINSCPNLIALWRSSNHHIAQEAAELGIPEGALFYGFNLQGQGNAEGAKHWFQKAWDAGIAEGAEALALIDLDSHCPAKAVELLRQAGEKGLGTAWYWLAECYRVGYGVSKSFEQYQLFRSRAVQCGLGRLTWIVGHDNPAILRRQFNMSAGIAEDRGWR